MRIDDGSYGPKPKPKTTPAPPKKPGYDPNVFKKPKIGPKPKPKTVIRTQRATSRKPVGPPQKPGTRKRAPAPQPKGAQRSYDKKLNALIDEMSQTTRIATQIAANQQAAAQVQLPQYNPNVMGAGIVPISPLIQMGAQFLKGLPTNKPLQYLDPMLNPNRTRPGAPNTTRLPGASNIKGAVGAAARGYLTPYLRGEATGGTSVGSYPAGTGTTTKGVSTGNTYGPQPQGSAPAGGKPTGGTVIGPYPALSSVFPGSEKGGKTDKGGKKQPGVRVGRGGGNRPYSGRGGSRSFRRYGRSGRSSYRSYRSYGGGGGGGGGASADDYGKFGIPKEYMEAYKAFWGQDQPQKQWSLYNPVSELFARVMGRMPLVTDWQQMWQLIKNEYAARTPAATYVNPYANLARYESVINQMQPAPLFTPPSVSYAPGLSF